MIYYCTSLPNSTFGNIILAAWNWSWEDIYTIETGKHHRSGFLPSLDRRLWNSYQCTLVGGGVVMGETHSWQLNVAESLHFKMVFFCSDNLINSKYSQSSWSCFSPTPFLFPSSQGVPGSRGRMILRLRGPHWSLLWGDWTGCCWNLWLVNLVDRSWLTCIPALTLA